jgi:hypothetical protein
MIREKIIFAGGCHIIGHPVGSEYAFPKLAAQELEREGIPCEIYCVPHVPLHRPEMVVSACREFRPDTLVLQPGNYEVTKDLRGYLMSLVRAGSERGKSSAPADVRPVGRFHFLVEARVKQIVDCALRHPLVDFQLLDSKMEQFLAAVAHCGPERVLVMSSTPCADPTQYYYRDKARPIIEAAAERHGCEFLDILRLAPKTLRGGLGRDQFFADPAHLGIAGQRFLGRMLAEHIRKVNLHAKVAL